MWIILISTIGIGLAVLLLAALIFVDFKKKNLRKKISYKVTNLSKEETKKKWKEIETLFYLGKPSNLAKAILDADKLFDQALKSAFMEGETMGERLKSSKHLFEQKLYSEVWEAHKLRNYIVHEMNAIINTSQVKEALASFKKGLVKLGKL